MLEASKAEIPVTSQGEDLHAEQGTPRIESHDAMPSSSKQNVIKIMDSVETQFTKIEQKKITN